MHLRTEGVKGWEEGEAYLRDDFWIVSVQV